MIWPGPVALTNARVFASDGEATSIRFGRRILGIGDAPHGRDYVVDLNGAWVLPGLINAHDHLELNHYGAQHAAAPYRNVQQWVDDMRSRLREDPGIVKGRSYSLSARLWAGGFKNLLAGVTLVAHHNPMYPGLDRSTPVRVLARFGWAHSLAMEREPVGARGEPGGAVVDRFRSTPHDAPFMIHVAEGVDHAARTELTRLDAAGVLAANTVLVHGVAIDHEGWQLVKARGSGIVWCPASNLALFGTTIDVRQVTDALPGRVALGTDSRLSGARDLLDELRVASCEGQLTPEERLKMVTTSAADLLRCPSAGRLTVGAPADLAVFPGGADSAGEALARSRRHDVQLVVIDGRPRVGAPEWHGVFQSRGVFTRRIRVDACPRIADARLVRLGARFAIPEPGVELRH